MQLGHLEIHQLVRHLYLVTRRGVEAGELAGCLTGQLLGPLESLYARGHGRIDTHRLTPFMVG
ncbi:hypothetical protein D3C80_1037880 [compost metagenome]